MSSLPKTSSIPVTRLPSAASPLVAIRILFHVGSAHDPAGKEGLAALTAALLAEGGSSRRSYAELLDALYPLAASIDVRADKEVTVLSGTVHRDNLERYWKIVSEVLLEPGFVPADFERVREDHLNAITTRLRATDDENLGKETLEAMIFAGHPYGRPVLGTVQGLRAIRLEDVKAFYRSCFTRENVEVGVAGGFDEAFLGQVLADLARLPGGRPVRPVLPEPRKPEGIEVTVVTKPARAWAISIGFPLDITRADEDFYPLLVANSYLGEHRTFNGILMQRMRGDRGLNYGDYSYIEGFVQDGGSTFPVPNIPRRQQFFSIWIRPVAPQHAHFAIRQALRELDRLVRDGLTEEEFEGTRRFLLHYSRLWTQTLSRRLGYEMDGRFYGRASLPEELARRLPRLTRDEVNEAIRRHLRAGGAYVAVVADEESAARFLEALRTNAPSPISYTTATRPEVLEEDKEIAVFPLSINADRARLVPATEMFER